MKNQTENQVSAAEAAHTPTPWHLKESVLKREFIAFIMDKEGNDIACASNSAHLTNVQNLANAAFIVRACNSYEADQRKIAALTEALENLVSKVALTRPSAEYKGHYLFETAKAVETARAILVQP